MELVVFFLLPPVITFVILAFLPAGVPAAIGHVCFGVLAASTAFHIYPIRPSVGPDDWFRGIEQIPFWGAVIVAGVTGLAQVWRYYRLRAGQPPYYAVIVGCLTAVAVFLAVTLIWS